MQRTRTLDLCYVLDGAIILVLDTAEVALQQGESGGSTAIIRAIRLMADSLGLEVVAEGLLHPELQVELAAPARRTVHRRSYRRHAPPRRPLLPRRARPVEDPRDGPVETRES